jgi:predicted Fe-Mo cluster-binding NifX family protein
MGFRFGVIADTAQECAEGLAMLERLRHLGVDVTVVQRPAQIGTERWTARAAVVELEPEPSV